MKERSSGDTPSSQEIVPVEHGTPDVRPFTEPAAGLGAVVSSLTYVIKEAGVIRGARALKLVNQTSGFDCPSCAWPDPKDRAMAEFCENGARAVGDEATTRKVDPAFFAKHSIDELRTHSDHWLNKQGRLTQPMWLKAGATHYEAISWSAAFELIGRSLRTLPSPDHALFYTSGRASNEAAFLFQLFARALGTNNMPDCSNMCHESSGTGLNEVIGVGKGTVSLDDFEHAKLILVIGQNPGTNHPRMLSALRDAKLRGCKVISINPLHEAALIKFRHPQAVGDMLTNGSVSISDLYLQVKIGGDIALLKGIMKRLVELDDASDHKVFDRSFIAEFTDGFDALILSLRALSWDDLVAHSGVARDQIEEAASLLAASDATIACWAMGITQHEHGVANVREIVNLLLLQGNIGKPGAGACPVRGHSNVQGDRTMGIWEKPPAWLDRLGSVCGFSPPRHEGHDVIGAIHAMLDGKASVFVALGGNFLSASPDTARTAEALSRCDLTVHISTKLNRSHLTHGREALILPCLGRTERDEHDGREQLISVEDSMSVVHISRGTLPPASKSLKSEVQIVAEMAKATVGDRCSVDWASLAADYDRIRDLIEQVVPGFERFNERVRADGGFVLTNLAAQRRFVTKTGKARFSVNVLPESSRASDELVMMTIRSHDQFNTTVYDLDDRYRGVYGHRRIVLINENDLRERGLRHGDHVSITSHFRGDRRYAEDFVVVAFDIPPGCVATYFPEANSLVPLDQFAEGSRTPASKSVRVRVHRYQPAAAMLPSSSPA
ncbi:MAG: FdhF/YdeP family oxidoreductase [Polyangiaceae bacterium]